MSSIAGMPGATGLYAEQLPANDAPTTAPTTSSSLPTPAPAAAFVQLPFSFGLAGLPSLGIAQPRSPEDTAALLAAITLALEETGRQTRENRIIGRNEGMRTSLGETLGTLASLEALADAINAMRGQLAAAKTEQAGKIDQMTQAEKQSASLGLQIGTLDAGIATLDQQIAAAAAQGRPTGALVAQRDALSADRNTLAKQKETVDATIQKLAGEIAALSTKIGELTVSIASSTTQFNRLQIALLFIFIQAALALNGMELQDETLARAASQNVTVTLDNVAENLREFGEDLQVREILAEIRQEGRLRQDGEERIAVTALALVTAITDVLATLASLDLPLDSPLGAAAAQSRGRVRVAV